MELENALKQSNGFDDEWEKSLLDLIYTANHINDNQYQFLKEFGFSTEQYNVLQKLKGYYP